MCNSRDLLVCGQRWHILSQVLMYIISEKQEFQERKTTPNKFEQELCFLKKRIMRGNAHDIQKDTAGTKFVYQPKFCSSHFRFQKKKLSGIKKISLKQTWNRLSDCKIAKKKHKRNQFSMKTLLSKKEHLINLETPLVYSPPADLKIGFIQIHVFLNSKQLHSKLLGHGIARERKQVFRWARERCQCDRNSHCTPGQKQKSDGKMYTTVLFFENYQLSEAGRSEPLKLYFPSHDFVSVWSASKTGFHGSPNAHYRRACQSQSLRGTAWRTLGLLGAFPAPVGGLNFLGAMFLGS